MIYNCDCYVSLHRSEGFGLTMAEAMFYGKPVIATPYSGNMDFMNVGNSFMVKFKLMSTDQNYGPYPKGSVWANPDVENAASLMRYVFDNPKIAQQVGETAASTIKSILSPQAIGGKIKERLDFIFKRIQAGSLSNNYDTYIEREWRKSQVTAWKKTTLKLQEELENLRQKQ